MLRDLGRQSLRQKRRRLSSTRSTNYSNEAYFTRNPAPSQNKEDFVIDLIFVDT